MPAADAVAAKLRQSVRAALSGRTETVQVGRYVVGDRLGAGGMGTVYRGRDELLARDVAIKLVPLPPAPRVERTVREAQAMAGIVHPNVVEVFDVGLTPDELYIVMQLVEGDTLRTWATTERGFTECLDVLLAAGEGLAAAHHAGFIHHDFKPDNVLIASDGRVAVSDFGLAALSDVSTDGTAADGTTAEDGGVGGTRGYASPERQAGNPGDARSDQFSWCATAYEILYGSVPNAGVTPPARSSRVGIGRVPPRVRRALQRGLSEDPAMRFADMRALLDACRPASTRRTTGVAFATAGVLGLGLALALNPAEAPRTARGTDEATEPTPSPQPSAARDHEIDEALAASQAARVEGNPEQALAHARHAEALVDAAKLDALRADVHLTLGRALDASGQYEESVAALNTALEFALQHDDSGLAAEAASELVWAHGTRLHEPSEGRRWGKAALLYLDRGGDYALAGGIHYRLGTLAAEEGDVETARVHFEDAIAWDQGEFLVDARTIAASQLALSSLDLRQGRVDAAEQRLTHARTLLDGAGDSVGPEIANVHSLLGAIAHHRSKYSQALDHSDAAMKIHRQLGTPLQGYEVSNAARVLMSMGRYDDALERAHEALALIEEGFGETSVETAAPLAAIAEINRRRGAFEDAEQAAWRAVITLESVSPTDTLSLAGPLMLLGEISFAQGKTTQGIKHLERSLAIRRQHSDRPAAIAATLMALAKGMARRMPAAASDRAQEAALVLESAEQDASEARRFVALMQRRIAEQ